MSEQSPPLNSQCWSSLAEKMKIYLTINSIEELNHWNKKEKKEAWRRVFKSMHKSLLPWIGYGIMFVLVYCLIILCTYD